MPTAIFRTRVIMFYAIILLSCIAVIAGVHDAYCFGAPNYLPDGPHPRIWLTQQRLSELRARQIANTLEWQDFYNWCESHLNTPGYDGGNLKWPGSGYRGDRYYEYITNYALAYQILKNSNPTKAAEYATYAKAIMNGMVSGFSVGEELNGLKLLRCGENDDRTVNATEGALLGIPSASSKNGYGARYAGSALPLAYDWLYDVLSVEEKTKFISVMYRWVDWYRGVRTTANNGVLINGVRYYEDQDGPCDSTTNICTTAYKLGATGYQSTVVGANFFAGFFEMATLVPLATYDGSAIAQSYQDISKSIYSSLLKPALTDPLRYQGGDSPEGWNYASGWPYVIKSLEAMRTATGENVYTGFEWPKDFFKAYLHATANNLTDTIRSGDWTGSQIGKAYEEIIMPLAYILRQGYTADIIHKKAQYYLANGTLSIFLPKGEKFLWYDPAAETADLNTEPLYYRAIGSGLVTMRSSWSNTPDAIFTAVQLGGFKELDHEAYDEGTLWLQRGTDRLLTHQNMASGSIAHNTIAFMDTDHYNVTKTLTKTAIDRIENGPDYLYVRGEISDAWKKNPPVYSKINRAELFYRNVVFLRPNRIVVYDVTRSNAAYGNVKSWYTQYEADPTIDTNTISVAVGSSKGYITTLFPTATDSNFTKTIPAPGFWRVKYVPSIPQEYDQFLHVIEATDANSSQTPTEKIQSIDGKMIGVFINDSNKAIVVMFSSDQNGNDVVGDVTYTIPSTSGTPPWHMIAHLAPNTDYTVIVPMNATDAQTYQLMLGNDTTKGAVYKTSAQGVLQINPNIPSPSIIKVQIN